MRMMKSVLAMAALLMPFSASAVEIDFNDYGVGPVTQIDDVTFSMPGEGEQGAPTIASHGGNNYLWNSSDGVRYPTNTILSIDFGGLVSNLNFTFNPFGLNGRLGQGWRIFGADSTLIANGLFSSSGLASYDLSSFGPIARLELSNGGNNWLQGVRTLSFDRTVAAPAPGTLALLGLGLAAMGFRRR